MSCVGNVWNSSTMLVLRLWWTYGLLMIFMIRSFSSAPANGSLPITIKLKEQLASKYGRLLKALISVNEERLDVMQKLQRLHELPFSVLRTKEPEVYAVWKLDTKPGLIEELLRDRTNNRNFAAILMVNEKPKSEESGILDFGKVLPEIVLMADESNEKEMNIIDAPIITTEKQKREESSSLEFWDPSPEVFYSEADGKETNKVDVGTTTTRKPENKESSSTKSRNPLQKVLYSGKKGEMNRIDVPIITTEKPEIEENSSLEFWKASQEVSDSNESDGEDEIMNLQDEATKPVKKNLIIIPYLSPLNGTLEFFEASLETTSKYKDLRRYKYAKDCSKKAAKYCKIACMEAFNKMCGRFKCTSQVKRNYKKQCRYVCLEEYVTDNKYFC